MIIVQPPKDIIQSDNITQQVDRSVESCKKIIDQNNDRGSVIAILANTQINKNQ